MEGSSPPYSMDSNNQQLFVSGLEEGSAKSSYVSDPQTNSIPYKRKTRLFR